MTGDVVVGWRYRLNGPEFEQAPGDGEGQRNLACFIQPTGLQSQTRRSD